MTQETKSAAKLNTATRVGRALAELDEYLRKTDPEMLAALARGAGDVEIRRLSEVVFGGEAPPPALETWFRWHNGQSDTSQELSPDRVFYLMPVRESIAAWKSLCQLQKTGDLQEPWKSTWIPIMANGGGDHLVFESGPTGHGRVIEYWHTDEDRDVAARDLAAFARAIVKMRKEVARGPKRLSITWNLDTTEPMESLEYVDIYDAPVGRTYFGGPVNGNYLVCVHVAPYDCWAAQWAGSQEAAFEAAQRLVEANDSMKFYAVPGAHAHASKLLEGAPGGARQAMATIE